MKVRERLMGLLSSIKGWITGEAKRVQTNAKTTVERNVRGQANKAVDQIFKKR
jgi:hypothetical protein